MHSKRHKPTKQSYRQSHNENFKGGRGAATKPRAGKGHNGEAGANVIFTGVNNGNINVSEHTTNREEIKKEHQEQLEKCGKVPSLKVEMSLLRTCVNQTLWKKKKFIAAGSELDFNSRLCIKVLTDLSVGGNSDNKRTFWCRNRKHICGILGIKRNNVVTSIKQTFFSK
jgi:hypothetical protein